MRHTDPPERPFQFTVRGLVIFVAICGLLCGLAQLNLPIAIALGLAVSAVEVCQRRMSKAWLPGLMLGGFVGCFVTELMPEIDPTTVPGVIVIAITGVAGCAIGALFEFKKPR